MKGGQALAPQALSIGMNTFDFVIGLGIMLYLLFFLLRDGKALAERIREAVPLRGGQKAALFAQIRRCRSRHGQGRHPGRDRARHARRHRVLVSRNPRSPAVGRADGVPVAGAGDRRRRWSGCPVAIYFLATGALWQGIGLILYGVLVIGLVDNLLRPFLVGKDSKLPDYVVLISTLGGIKVFGLNGFVVGPLIAAMFMVSWEIFAASRATSGNDATGNAAP